MRMKNILLILIFFYCSNLFSENNDFWIPLNVPDGGSVYDLKCSPDNTLYAIGYHNLWHSSDQGRNWDILKKSKISQVAFDSQNNIYAVEWHDKFSYRFNSYPSGYPFLIKSTNKGQNWDTLMSVWENTSFDMNYSINYNIMDLKIASDDRIYLVIFDNLKDSVLKAKIMYSDNLGENWNFIEVPKYYDDDIIENRVREIFPYKEGHFVLSRAIRTKDYKYKYFTSITSNNGNNYEDFFENGLPFEVHYFNENKILVNFGTFTLYTTDGGENWSQTYFPYQGFEYCISLIAKSENELYAFSNTYKLLHSTDMGKTWDLISNDEKTNKFPRYLDPLFIMDSTDNMYYTHILGFSKSTDGGKTFTKSSKGYVQGPPLSLRLRFDKKGNVYYSWDGIYISRDNGLSWEHHDFDRQRIEQMVVLNDGTVLAYPVVFDDPYVKGKVYRSTDEGRNWDTLTTYGGAYFNFEYLLQSPTGTIFGATGSNDGAYRSLDSGKTYEALWQNNKVGGRGVVINNEGHIFTLSSKTGIYRSTDDGDSWETVYDFSDYPYGSHGTEVGTVYPGIFHPDKPIGYFGIETRGGFPLIVTTTDNGASWYYEKEARAYTAVVDSLYNLWRGALRSSDYGDSWELILDGLDYWPPVEMGVNSRGYIFMVMEYGGIYRSREAIVSVRDGADEPKDEIILVAPNPFSEKTDIQYYISQNAKVKLSVYDIFGREVIRLVDNKEQYGHQSFTLDGAILTSGVYLLTLNAEGITKSVMLMKY
jgi:photosystem II stability/assembly factor-like uncharacterized protein